MSRRRFSEREVIETLIRTGHEIRSYRSKEVITLETVRLLEREHFTPLALGGADDPTNCGYSIKAEHSKQTNGTKATSYGSDKHAIAKVRRLRGELKPKAKKDWPSRKMQSAGFETKGRGFQKAGPGYKYQWSRGRA